MKKTIEVVAAILINELGELLCVKRSERMSLSNYWEFPGGKIENGENPIEALKREINEELCIEIDVSEKKFCETLHEYENIIVRLLFYKGKILNGIPVLIEHSEMKWSKIKDLKDLDWAPADIEAVEKLIQTEEEFWEICT